MLKVLVIDDSALMRRLLSQVLTEAGLKVAMARNGREGVEQVTEWQPDVVTLDVNMPEMDGLTALSLIMQARPTPVVMVSSLTERGAQVTLEALALGAVDYVAKPGGTISLSMDSVAQDLVNKVRCAARARLRMPGPHEPHQARSGRLPARENTPRARTHMDQVMHEVTADIVETLGDMQFQDFNRQLLEQINHALGSLSAHFAQLYKLIDGQAPPPPMMLEELMQVWTSNYVMHSQRVAHVLGSGGSNEGEVVVPDEQESVGQLELSTTNGPRIELF